MYSLSTSFCTVPESLRMSAPCRFATATYSASRIDAVELMVIEVEIFVRSMPENRRSMSSTGVDRHADLADFSHGERVVGVQPDLRGQVEGHR